MNQLREGGLAFDHLRSTRDVFTVHLAARPAPEGPDEASSRRAPRGLALSPKTCIVHQGPGADSPAAGWDRGA